ncbi:MAG: MFS transporter [Lachnospiraceae bacterium]|nr:MFS transporter [Lachnospiraceae bacterium]MBP5183684.1 MFS transporter [Lachnospiraceae bacterium]
MYILLLLLIYLAFIGLGLPDSLLGSAWPVMHEFMGVPISSMGIVTMIISGGTIVSSLLSERMIKRFGTRFVTLFSTLLTALALLGFSFSDRFYMLCLWGIPYGLGAGAIDAALNNYVALHYSSKHMSWLHCFWGVGTIISPYVMSFALLNYNWQAGYRMVAGLQLIIALILCIGLPLWKVNSPASQEESKKPLGLVKSLRIPGVPLLLAGFFGYCAAEATCIHWMASFLIGTRGVTKERAAAFASLFCIGITIGRFVSGFISDKLKDRGMIRLGTAVSAVGILLMGAFFLPEVFSLAGCVIMGLGCAPVYPSIIHSTPDNFGAENSQAIIGVQMASAYLGSTFMPPLFGILSSKLGMRIMPVFLAFFVVMMIIMIELTYKKRRNAI